MNKTYTIFGAGPGGLYTAWRLASSGKLNPKDTINIVEWGNYDFEDGKGGTRRPAGRICSHHYKNDTKNSFVELGGMRFDRWKEDNLNGHELVTKTIHHMGLADEIIEFEMVDNPLFRLRGSNFYLKDIGKDKKAPYYTPYNDETPSDVYADIGNRITGDNTELLKTRQGRCCFYSKATLPEADSFVYNSKDMVSNVGFWNLFYDYAGTEASNYARAGEGYDSNLINSNAADAAIINAEFGGAVKYSTLRSGYSTLFVELFKKAKKAAEDNDITFSLQSEERLQSIWQEDGEVKFRTATTDRPFRGGEVQNTDFAFLAMPRQSLELIAQVTRSLPMDEENDFLNHPDVANYIEAIVKQPSLKVAMFFKEAWWNKTKYPPQLSDGHFGPSLTDIPLRQVYYFGNNASDEKKEDGIQALLASYDDMEMTTFWQQMVLSTNERRTVASRNDFQPVEGPITMSASFKRMIRLQLAKLHYGDSKKAKDIPDPLEAHLVNWGLNPFGAGYHGWAPHFDICDVMRKIRYPAQMAGGKNNVFIIGSAYSPAQAWVEGAFLTAESVLGDQFGIDPLRRDDIVDPAKLGSDYREKYPFVCGDCDDPKICAECDF